MITCEHGGNSIPEPYQALFRDHRAALGSHRGYDPGALALARDFSSALDAPLVYSTTSRLLVELNRSIDHPALFSEIMRTVPAAERKSILRRYYTPYRRCVEAHVASYVKRAEGVTHISCHSFTPCLNGVTRRADIGLLYDPSRESELAFCIAWQRLLEAAEPHLRVRRNYPYRGWCDGLTTHLRSLHADARYAGIELEVNQKHTLGDQRSWKALRRLLLATLRQTLAAQHAATHA